MIGRSQMIMVTVIVPVYNSENTLGRCIDSILSQSFRDFELLVVDNGSSDASYAIARKYACMDGRVKVLQQPVKGVSAARNMGLDYASGTYVAFCDSDDTVEADWLLRMVEGIGDAGLAVCGYNVHGNVSGNRERVTGTQVRFRDAGHAIGTLLEARLLPYIWNKLFRRDVIEKAGLRFEEGFTVFEDEYFVLGYLLHSADTVSIPYCGYDYFLPDGFNAKYDFSVDDFRKVADLFYKLVSGARERPRLPSVIYWYKFSLCRYVGTHSYSQAKEKISYAKRLAADFHDGPFSHLTLRILPCRCLYCMLKLKAGRNA